MADYEKKWENSMNNYFLQPTGSTFDSTFQTIGAVNMEGRLAADAFRVEATMRAVEATKADIEVASKRYGVAEQRVIVKRYAIKQF
jgi:hypothetical protein